jgi:hypothetical protein
VVLRRAILTQDPDDLPPGFQALRAVEHLAAEVSALRRELDTIGAKRS